MSSQKFSISTSRELFDAVEDLRERRDQDRSSLIEMLLREHPLVRREIRRHRRRNRPEPRRGREEAELEGLARTARRQWEKKAERGEVGFLDR